MDYLGAKPVLSINVSTPQWLVGWRHYQCLACISEVNGEVTFGAFFKALSLRCIATFLTGSPGRYKRKQALLLLTSIHLAETLLII